MLRAFAHFDFSDGLRVGTCEASDATAGVGESTAVAPSPATGQGPARPPSRLPVPFDGGSVPSPVAPARGEQAHTTCAVFPAVDPSPSAVGSDNRTAPEAGAGNGQDSPAAEGTPVDESTRQPFAAAPGA